MLPHLQSVYLTRGLSLMKLLFLFFLTPLFPSPQMALLFLCPPLSLPTPLHSAFSPLRLSALFISAHFCFIFDGSLFRSDPLLPRLLDSHPISLCSYLSKVDYRTEDGTANAGSDYEFAEGTLLFKPGETLKGINISHSPNR